MAHKHSILIAVLVLLVLVLLSGCGDCNSRESCAQQRWQGVMEQARIDAAMESIEQGNLQYAICILDDLVESDSAFTEWATETRAELRTAVQLIAQARTDSISCDTQSAAN